MENEIFNYNNVDVKNEAERLKNKIKNTCGCIVKPRKNIFRTPYDTISLRLATTDELSLRPAIELTNPMYQLQALMMAKALNPAIETTAAGQRMNMEKVVPIVNSMNPLAAIVGILDQTITHSESSVEAMVTHILQIIKDILGVTLGTQTLTSLKAEIDSVFTNLAVQEDGAWIFFHEEHGAKTEYTYNMLFCVQNEHTGALMLAVPMSFEVRAYVSKKQILFITLEDVVRYEVRIQSLSIIQALHPSLGDLPLSSLIDII